VKNLGEYITTLSQTDTDNVVVDNTEDANIRYIGKTPSNYLCFDSNCSNGKWRVIGIMNNMTTSDGDTESLIKIVRNTSIGNYAWDNEKNNDWTISSLKTYLNEDWYDSNLKTYDDLIKNVVWNLGGNNSAYYIADVFYTSERQTSTFNNDYVKYPSTWTGKVALMYASDYAYATSGGSSIDRAYCLSNYLENWSSYSDCYYYNYLYRNYDQWILNPGNRENNYAFYIKGYESYSYMGSVSSLPTSVSESVRPSVYLSFNTNILSGSGTSDDPWVISNLALDSSTSNTQGKNKVLSEYITTLSETDTENLITDDTDDANVRYIGKSPNNFVCFDENCISGRWRVIGIMNNMTTSDGETKSLVKVIRSTSTGYTRVDKKSKNNWESTSLSSDLNGDWYTANLADYDNLIESVVWKLGGYSSTSITAKQFYTYERGTKVYSGNSTEWTGKIGLMYPSDYGYATSGGDIGRSTCLSYNLNSWKSYGDCYNNDFMPYSAWMITPYSSNSSVVFQSYYFLSGSNTYNNGNVYPTMYLNSNVRILSGRGTSENPWIIGI
jgi:hypothetical protein